MKNVSKIIPCYAADTSGVCSALYELGGLTVVHDASGCNSTYSTHDEPRWYDMRSKIYISALTELDSVMGNDEKIISDVVSAAHDQEPEFIALCGSPMPMMTGFDYDAVADEIEQRSGVKTIPLHTNGMNSYIDGASEAFCSIVKAYAEKKEKIINGVNILGLTPLDFPLGAEKDIRNWLSYYNFECICTLAMGASLDDVRNMGAASLDLVISQSGLAAAEYMKAQFGIPYVCAVPYGKQFSKKLAAHMANVIKDEDSFSPFVLPCNGFPNADTVVIGEGVSAGSLTAALWADMKLEARLLCTLPSPSFFTANSGGVISAEEDIEAYLKETSPKTVIADPLYKYIVPHDTRFIELPHFAFSGRCFQKDMRSLINKNIKEYFK
ncbi:MAG: oxalate:formate antiporter [Ruminococcus sp.]|nr:oxalate:formate antiporter [Ruminococcus sp.]